MALVEIEKLTSHYGRIPALRGVDMKIEARQLSVLVGANGAGKTTLMRTISGVRPASGGDIRFEGASIRRLSAAKRVRLGIAQVPEGRQMFPALTVEDNLVMGGYTRTVAEVREGIDRAFALFPLLDERSMGLAPLLVAEIFRSVQKLQVEGVTIFLVEQNAHAALKIADRAYVMETGRTVLEGTGPELLANDRVRQAYLGI